MNRKTSISELHERKLAGPDRGTAEFRRQTMNRLKRIETRLVAGFESLGASLVNHADGIKVDVDNEVIYIDSLGTTVGDLMEATKGHRCEYHVVYNGKIKCVFSNQ